jgi:hypothetical protein
MKSYEIAKAHFDQLSSSPEGQREIAKFDAIMQFDIKDDESFHIEIAKGKVSVVKGKASAESRNVMTFLTDRATVREIFQKGQLYPGLADFMFEGKLWFKVPKAGGPKDGWIAGEKSTTAWAAQLLRMHV